MALERPQLLPQTTVPEPDGLIVARRRQELAVRGERNTGNRIGVTGEGSKEVVRGWIPQLDGFGIASRREHPTIRAVAQGEDFFGVGRMLLVRRLLVVCLFRLQP